MMGSRPGGCRRAELTVSLDPPGDAVITNHEASDRVNPPTDRQASMAKVETRRWGSPAAFGSAVSDRGIFESRSVA